MELEQIYIANTNLEHRKKYAQFFTPQPIVDLMTDWVLSNKKIKTVLEPAFGLGIFSRAIQRRKLNIEIKGFEIDETILALAKSYFDNFNSVSLELNDYMYSDWNNKYDGIICNPPYLKFHDYDNINIIKEVEDNLKVKFNGFTNLYTLFLLKSIYQLKHEGRAAFIIPSEFLNSDYGKLIKKYLLQSRVLRHIFIIDFKENIFDDALTTASILLMSNDNNNSKVNISTIESKDDLELIRKSIVSYPLNTGKYIFNTEDLDPFVKWRQYYQPQNSNNYTNLVPFSTYAKVVRGIATGDNDYFTFKKSKAKQYLIPKDNLLPCICKSKQVQSSFFTEDDFRSLENDDELVYIFNGIHSKNENVLEYIEKGEKEEVNMKYLTNSRNPWYSLEKRPPAPIWVSVFNRNGVKFIRNEANISNLTTFHCIYPTDSSLFSKVNIDLLFAYLLTDVAKEIFNDNRREYGNGLNKFEPNDINKSKMLDLSILDESTIEEILKIYREFRLDEKEHHIIKIDSILRNVFSKSRVSFEIHKPKSNGIILKLESELHS